MPHKEFATGLFTMYVICTFNISLEKQEKGQSNIDTVFKTTQFCDERHGKNFNCRHNQAAYPFLPQRNFGTDTNIPRGFLDNPGRYFYLSRFLYSFYIIDVVFASLAFIAGLLALCSRIGGAAAALFSALALFCVTFSATIMTYVNSSAEII